MAGRERDKLCRVRLRSSPVPSVDDGAKTPVDAESAKRESSEAMLDLVRALARAAAIADYNRHHRTTDASSDSESGDLRKI
jgi:hypothetical protein